MGASTPLRLDRRELWDALGGVLVLHEDAHLLAVAKPAGVPCQSARPELPDDLPHRLKEHLRARGGDAYLGIHQRLDQATSGVVVYTRSKEANPGLARQMEGRTVRKTYVAAVRGEVGEGEVLLRHHLGREGERSVVLDRPSRKSREAISRVRLLRRGAGDRALVEVRIETGRTHQIRAQLAHVGLPVAGDRLYGGERAPRLLLHAARLGLDHPVSGEPLDLRAPLPEVFERWLAGEDGVPFTDPQAVRDAVRDAMESRWGLGRAGATERPTTAFRLLNRGGEGVPGLAVDVYGDHLVAHLYGDRATASADRILDVLDELGFAGVYVKKHPRQKNELAEDERRLLAPSTAVRGADAPDPLVVAEHGVGYATALGDGLSTGLFLDQRDARLRLAEVARGKRVLNLFCYAGAFGIAAAVGGAREVVQVDVSRPALDRAAQSEEANGVRTERVRHDCFTWLANAVKRGERFDLVVVDPPSYSTTKGHRWTSGRDWVGLAESCLRVTRRDGVLVVSSNDGRMTTEALRRHVHEGARRAGVTLAQMKELPEPQDFPGAALHRLWIQLGAEPARRGRPERRSDAPARPKRRPRRRRG
ncbi:MAG: hypothetical protein CMN30_26325 [Sandaracinus sp.]|nr:hypothetical protein [Sandaracinus sp.]